MTIYRIILTNELGLTELSVGSKKVMEDRLDEIENEELEGMTPRHVERKSKRELIIREKECERNYIIMKK